jgi:hypothetical protein
MRWRRRRVIERQAESGRWRLGAWRERVPDQHVPGPHDDPEGARDVAARADLQLEVVGQHHLFAKHAGDRRPQRQPGKLPFVGGKLDDDQVDRDDVRFDLRTGDRDAQLPAHRLR